MTPRRIYKEEAIDVIYLVLKDLCHETNGVYLQLLAIYIEASDDDPFRPLYHVADFRDAQTPLFHRVGALGFDYDRVEDRKRALAIILRRISVEDDESLRDSYLGRRQSDSAMVVHRFDHILYELIIAGIDVLYRFALLPENRVSQKCQFPYGQSVLILPWWLLSPSLSCPAPPPSLCCRLPSA